MQVFGATLDEQASATAGEEIWVSRDISTSIRFGTEDMERFLLQESSKPGSDRRLSRMLEQIQRESRGSDPIPLASEQRGNLIWFVEKLPVRSLTCGECQQTYTAPRVKLVHGDGDSPPPDGATVIVRRSETRQVLLCPAGHDIDGQTLMM